MKNYYLLTGLFLIITFSLFVNFLSPVTASQNYKEQQVAYNPEYDEIIQIIYNHYNAIGDRDFKTAYYLRSNNWRANHSYNSFYNNWENNIYIDVPNVKVVSSDGYNAVVKIRIYSEDEDSYGRKICAYYRGKIYLVYENGWKIDDIKISKE